MDNECSPRATPSLDATEYFCCSEHTTSSICSSSGIIQDGATGMWGDRREYCIFPGRVGGQRTYLNYFIMCLTRGWHR